MASLEIHDPSGPRNLALTDGQLVCGRQYDCDLVLDDVRCSKKHCRFERKGGRWRLVDLASANGTWVNGQSISMVELAEGDEVVVGDLHMIFRMSAGRAPAIGAGERAAKASRMPIIVAGVAVLIAVAVIALNKGGSAESREGDDTQRSAVAAGGDEVGPESAGAEAAFLRSSMQTEWASLENDTRVLLRERILRARELADRAGPVDIMLADQMRAWADGQDKAENERQRARLANLRVRAQAAAEAGGFAASLAEFDGLIIELQALGEDRLLREVRSAKLDLLGRARKTWEEVEAEAAALADAGDFPAARNKLIAAAPGFGGTAFEAAARSAVQLLEIRASGHAADVAAAKPTPGRDQSPAVKVEKVDGSASGIIAEAEKAAAQRDWKSASEGYAKALELARGETLTSSWGRRAATLQALARLKNAVVVAVNAEDKRVKSLKIGRLSARPFAADQDIIQLKFGGAGLVTWNWGDIPGDTLLDLFSYGVHESRDQLDYALAAIEYGDEKRALAALVQAAQGSALKVKADEIFAAWRAREIPAGGFIVEEGGFWGPEEWSAIELRRTAKKEAEKLIKARRAQLPELVARVKALGEPALEPLQAALEERYRLALEDADRLGAINQPARYRGDLLVELDRRRDAALLLIRDEKRYPYPYGANQKAVQDEVNALVEQVRQVYEQPSVFILDGDKTLAEKLVELEEINGLMIIPASDRPRPSDLLDRVDRAIDLRTFGRSATDQRANEETRVFNAEIKSTITADEREVHRLTNEYRLMMGLRAVKIDEALVLAARGHSQEMKDLGYFAHNSPTPGRETPGQRCRLAGWGGSASENIAQGQRTSADAVQGWINSSGHHRNILGARWTHLGCGKAKDGFYWTQNFGSGASSAISREKVDPAEAAEADKQKPDAGR